MDMEQGEKSERGSGIWCVAARVAPYPHMAAGAKPAPRPFEAGAVVYCFPPNVAGAYESVKVVGPSRRESKWISATLSAAELVDWRAQTTRDANLIAHLSPPWDATQISRDVAKGIAAWKQGGPCPTAELRLWNRSHAQTQTGPSTLLGRLRSAVSKILPREA
jgi:hypothetical protein